MEKVKTNVDAYNLLVQKCHAGYRQDVQRGSFENEGSVYRMQAYPIMLEIIDPTNFLYLPKDVTEGMIEQYYRDYLLSDTVAGNEKYTYGERIAMQFQPVLDMIAVSPNTNQASISISQPSDINLSDPPCLRGISFSYFDPEPAEKNSKKRLHMTSFWRSNDIGEAFLMNQGGFALMLLDIAEYAGISIGSHFYCSPGAHVYVRESENGIKRRIAND